MTGARTEIRSRRTWRKVISDSDDARKDDCGPTSLGGVEQVEGPLVGGHRPHQHRGELDDGRVEQPPVVLRLLAGRGARAGGVELELVLVSLEI